MMKSLSSGYKSKRVVIDSQNRRKLIDFKVNQEFILQISFQNSF